MSIKNRKHGEAIKRTREYDAWKSMRQRCNNPSSKKFLDYGGRGIRICERWGDFENFLADMGRCPARMTLDRIDNNAGYSPENCRWATPKEQTVNRRTTLFVSIGGTRASLKDACRLLDLNYGSVYALVRHHGMAPQAAIENANARAAERIR